MDGLWIEEGVIRDGKIGKGRGGGCEETFLCLIQTKEKCRFTVPPAVALLNYVYKQWYILADFLLTGTFRGVFST